MAAANLPEVIGHLIGNRPLTQEEGADAAIEGAPYPDLADVRAQPEARRALEMSGAASS